MENCLIAMFRQMKGLRIVSEEAEGRCMRGSDEKLCFNEDRGKVWKDYIKRIMNEENDWG